MRVLNRPLAFILAAALVVASIIVKAFGYCVGECGSFGVSLKAWCIRWRIP